MNQQEFAARAEAVKTRLYRTAYLYLGNESDALDAVDEAVYQALRGLKQLRQPDYFETWITRILINVCHNELRRRKRFHPEPEHLAEWGEPDSALQRLEDRQTVLELHRHLHAMPEPYREVFELRVFGELQFQEIAAIFEKSESWAKMTYYRARARLARQMEVRDGTENS